MDKIVKIKAVSLEQGVPCHKDYKFVYYFDFYKIQDSYGPMYQKWMDKRLWIMLQKIKTNFVIVDIMCDNYIKKFLNKIKSYKPDLYEIKYEKEGIYVIKKE